MYIHLHKALLIVYFTVTLMDHIGLSTILNFPACETKQCVDVTIVDDDVLENVESFDVTLERTLGLDTRITLDPVDGAIEITDNEGLFPSSSKRELYGRLLEIKALEFPISRNNHFN